MSRLDGILRPEAMLAMDQTEIRDLRGMVRQQRRELTAVEQELQAFRQRFFALVMQCGGEATLREDELAFGEAEVRRSVEPSTHAETWRVESKAGIVTS